MQKMYIMQKEYNDVYSAKSSASKRVDAHPPHTQNTTHTTQKYKLGTPVAWSYFQAEYDNYVVELNSALAGQGGGA